MPGFLVPCTRRTPQLLKRIRSTIANHIQRHIRQPLQGEHCRSQRFYRHSVFVWFFTTPRRIQPICLSSSVESMSAPFANMTDYIISVNGGAVGYRPPVQNDYCTTDSESSPLAWPTNYSLLDWKLQVFKL